MTQTLVPFATFRPVSYRADAGPFTQAPLGWVLHVVVGDGSPYDTFENAVSPNRRFSHLWVAKDGSCEQYAELTNKSWAQAAGNGLYWSVETEGLPSEPLTDAQITTLARIHNFLVAADAVVDTVGGKGVGTHVMGGAAWGGHTCPGPGPRGGQRQAIIDKAKTLRPAPSPIPAPPVPTPAPSPAPALKPVNHNTGLLTEKPWGAFPLPPGNWYGIDDHTPNSHSGARIADQRAVKQIQREVGAYPDGAFGPRTEALVVAYQKRRSLKADGAVGQITWHDMTQND